VPRLAQRRLILFFCPIRASSANQISSGLPSASCVAIVSRRAGNLFKSSHSRLALGVMARASRELAVAQSAHLPTQRLLRDRDPVLVPEPLDQIDKPPAHYPVHRRNGTALDKGRQVRPMLLCQPGGLAQRLAVDEPLRSLSIELEHPVPHNLQGHAPDPRRLGARGPLIDRC